MKTEHFLNFAVNLVGFWLLQDQKENRITSKKIVLAPRFVIIALWEK